MPRGGWRFLLERSGGNVTGKVVMPGLVNTHSHIGGVHGADASAPIQPDVRAIDAINVADSAIQKAQAGGITTVNVMPGSGHLMSGQTAYLKLRDRKTIDALLLTTERGEALVPVLKGERPLLVSVQRAIATS